MVVVILSASGDWYKVIYNLQEGYMHRDYLDVTNCENVELGYGVINSYCVNLRSGPSTSDAVVAQAYEGAKAYIIGINNGWYKVIYNGTNAYVRSDLLDLTEYPYENRDSSNSPKYYRKGASIGSVPESSESNSSSAQESEQTTASGTAVVKADALYLRAKATTNSTALDMAYRNDSVSLLAQEGVWYKVSYNGQEGYMHGDYLGIGESATINTVGQKIVDCAMQYLGVPYVWGGSSPSGFDCSGLVQYVARSCGYSIGRTVSQQWPYGTEVSKENLRPGDIVFFTNTYTSGFSHVGIYVGDGNFIHAPSSGSVVKITSLESSYYASHYYGARRLG